MGAISRSAIGFTLSLSLVIAQTLPFTCPAGNSALPSEFCGTATGATGSTLITTPTAFFQTLPGDSIGNFSCVLGAFVNPNAPMEVFITIGNQRNAPADQDVTCAFLSLATSKAPHFAESDPSGQLCPIKAGLPFSAWAPSPPALPACPERSVAVPAELEGEGVLQDAAQSGNSRLLLQGRAWTTVEQGSLVTVRCVASVSSPPAQPAGLVQLVFSNAARSGAAQACAWALPKGATHLQYKLGAGAACPTDFAGAATIPFAFNSTAAG